MSDKKTSQQSLKINLLGVNKSAPNDYFGQNALSMPREALGSGAAGRSFN